MKAIEKKSSPMDSNKINIPTEQEALSAALVLKKWCMQFNTGKKHCGVYVWDCSKCPFHCLDGDGDGDCSVFYPMDWHLGVKMNG